MFIFSETFEDHVTIILHVMNEMREMQLSLRADKCEFGFRKVEFLGYVIDGNVISPSPSNILKVKQFPKPHNKKVIHRFMGLDHAAMPPTSKGNTGFLLLVDVCTKLIIATAIPNQTAGVLRSVLWSKWYAYFAIPMVLLSDQAKNMDGNVIRQLCDELAIEKRHSSPYHPQENGHAERELLGY